MSEPWHVLTRRLHDQLVARAMEGDPEAVVFLQEMGLYVNGAGEIEVLEPEGE